MTEMLLPLEERLKELSSSARNKFVDMSVDYYERYKSLLNSLRSNVYPHINAGLASLSKSPGLYTDHGERHFDEVVRYAGLLLEGNEDKIEPYELYILLCAIRIHDAGNIDGREEHEKRTQNILKQYGGDINTNSMEVRLISQIAQSHGGYIEGTKDKDTIGSLQETPGVGPQVVRARLIAAIVRFADEICEHSARASNHNLKAGNVIPTSYLFQLYAQSIQTARIIKKDKLFCISFYLNIDFFKDKYPVPDRPDKYFIDDVLDRIEKLNTERLYCNRFLLREFQVDRIEVTFDFYRQTMVSSFEYQQPIETKKFSIFDQGYPDPPKSWRVKECSGISGEFFSTKEWSTL